MDSATKGARCGIEPFIQVQILLRKPWRTRHGVETVRKIGESLGIEPTASGTATISGRIERRTFESLFATPAEAAGAEGIAAGALPVPNLLQEYVESITVAPPHIYMIP